MRYAIWVTVKSLQILEETDVSLRHRQSFQFLGCLVEVVEGG